MRWMPNLITMVLITMKNIETLKSRVCMAHLITDSHLTTGGLSCLNRWAQEKSVNRRQLPCFASRPSERQTRDKDRHLAVCIHTREKGKINLFNKPISCKRVIKVCLQLYECVVIAAKLWNNTVWNHYERNLLQRILAVFMYYNDGLYTTKR